METCQNGGDSRRVVYTFGYLSLGKQEKTAMLDEVDRYEIKGSELKFYDDKKVVAEFRAVQDAAAKKK